MSRAIPKLTALGYRGLRWWHRTAWINRKAQHGREGAENTCYGWVDSTPSTRASISRSRHYGWFQPLSDRSSGCTARTGGVANARWRR